MVLSHTVSAGISTYVALGRLPDEAIHTADFIEKLAQFGQHQGLAACIAMK